MSDDCRVPMKIAAKSCSALVFFVIGALLPTLGCCSDAGHEVQKARISFGLIADIQYADKDPSGSRHYRESLTRLGECVADLNTQDLAFAIQVGDIIDSGPDSFDRVLPVFNRLRMPRHHALGNHDFPLPRPDVLAKLQMQRPYYSFSHGRWRLVVLETADICVDGGWPESSENYQQAEHWIERLEREGKQHAQPWNGGIGDQQKQWLQDTLAQAAAEGQRVIVFGHIPLLAAASAEWALLYNHDEIVEILETSGSVVACFSGHEHSGGYAEHHGIHYVTLQGMVEAPKENAYAIVDLYDDKIEIRGVGKVPSRCLPIPARPTPATALTPPAYPASMAAQ